MTLLLMPPVRAEAKGISIPEEIKDIPEEYFEPAKYPGRLLNFYYKTRDAFDYENGRELEKRVMVYLPYGYSFGEKFDIIYVMHGGGSHESWIFGTQYEPSDYVNVMDHAIEDGLMRPVIIVCCTYNNADYNKRFRGQQGDALKLCQAYHNELVNDLMPAVEGTFKTYAEDTTPAGLKASAQHRCFAGFSNGAVCTWEIFMSAGDYFYYYFPMSAGEHPFIEDSEAAASARKSDSFFVLTITGGEDFNLYHERNRAEDMRNSPYFTEQTDTQNGNFAFRVKEGRKHLNVSAQEYMFNGFQILFGADEAL